MKTEDVLQKANRIIGTGLSDELLGYCSTLLMDANVSCDGLVMLFKELSVEIDKTIEE